jgi:hypothetical protein
MAIPCRTGYLRDERLEFGERSLALAVRPHPLEVREANTRIRNGLRRLPVEQRQQRAV